MRNFTVVIVTQIIEHKSDPKQKICSSEQSQLHCESVFRAEDIQRMVHKKIKELHNLELLPPLPPFLA